MTVQNESLEHGQKLGGICAFDLKMLRKLCSLGRLQSYRKSSFMGKDVHPGPILESKGICAIFQKKSKQGQNIWQFGQKCQKFENILKKGQPHACNYRMHETARICPDTPALYAQRIKGIIIQLRKTVYINVYLYVNQTLLKVKTETNTTNYCCHMPIHSPYIVSIFRNFITKLFPTTILWVHFVKLSTEHVSNISLATPKWFQDKIQIKMNFSI